MARLVDCSHIIEDGMVTYPGLPGPRIGEYLSRADSRANYEQGTEFHFGTIEMVANTGTYLDTPFHRFATGYDLADLPLERAANLPGSCVRSTSQAVSLDVLPDDVAGKAVLFATGWDRHWGTDRYGHADHPYLADDTIERLVVGGAALVGIDSVNIDDTSRGTRPAHSRLLEAGIPVVEHLTGLDLLADTEFRFFAVPQKVRGLGTFPVRAFALIE
jgi:kynurenine formamidase